MLWGLTTLSFPCGVNFFPKIKEFDFLNISIFRSLKKFIPREHLLQFFKNLSRMVQCNIPISPSSAICWLHRFSSSFRAVTLFFVSATLKCCQLFYLTKTSKQSFKYYYYYYYAFWVCSISSSNKTTWQD